jgi:hypothetical protein
MEHTNSIRGRDQPVNTLYELVLKGPVIDVGLRSIVRTAKSYRGRQRFAINLPISRNDLWDLLWQRKIPVKVFLVISSNIDHETDQLVSPDNNRKDLHFKE